MIDKIKSEEKLPPNRMVRVFLSERDIHELLSGNTIVERFISPDSYITVCIVREGNNKDLEEDNKNELSKSR